MVEFELGNQAPVEFGIELGSGTKVLETEYLSLERLGDYLYKATFDNVPEYKPINNTNVGGCTSFVRDGKLYRHFDWLYNECPTFIVRTKEFEGIAAITTLIDGELNKEILGQLPYHVVDGCNNYGIRVSTHVLFNDFEFAGDGNNPIELLPNYILNNVKSLDNLNAIRSYISSLSVPTQLKEAEYLLQFLVTDGTTTYYIGPSENGYEIVNATSNPKLTNFKWVNRSVVDRTDSDLQDRPTGIERWNSVEISDLEDLRFTLAYESPNRLSEFIGENGTTKDSTDAELMPIYNIAHNAYLRRTRNGATWQTVHSVVYSNKGIESLYVQEDFDKNYINNVDLTGYATEEWVEAQGYLTEHQDISGLATKVELQAVENEIPTNTSELTNDSGFIANADIVITPSMVISQDPLKVQLNDAQYAIIQNTQNNFITMDATQLGVGKTIFNKSISENGLNYVLLAQECTYEVSQYTIQSGRLDCIIINMATKVGTYSVVGLANRSELDEKQDVLTAGANITIQNNVISASGGLSEVAWGGITGTLSNQTDLKNALDNIEDEIPTVPTNVSAFTNDAGYLTQHQDISGKQDKLTAGSGIDITNNVISATGSGSPEIYWVDKNTDNYNSIISQLNLGKFVAITEDLNASIKVTLFVSSYGSTNPIRFTNGKYYEQLYSNSQWSRLIEIPELPENLGEDSLLTIYSGEVVWNSLDMGDGKKYVMANTNGSLNWTEYIPTPPSTGTKVLKCINGVMQWVAE